MSYPGTALRVAPIAPVGGPSSAAGIGVPAGPVRQRQQPRLAAGARAADEAVAPHVLPPADDPPGGVQAGRQPGQHGRADRAPAQLVLAGPEHPHRAAGHRPGQQQRVGRRVVRGVVPVDAGALDVVHDQLARVQAEPGGQRPAQREDALAVRPHAIGRRAVPAGDRAARRHRGVREERPGVLGLPGERGPGGRGRVTAPDHRLGLRSGADSRKPRRSSSSGSDSRTVHRAAAASRAAAVTATRSRSATTPRNEPSVTCATTPAGRSAGPTPSSARVQGRGPDHPAVQHARQHQVVQEAGAAGHLVRQVDAGRAAARDRPPGGRLGHGRAGHRPVRAGRARPATSS